MGARPEEAHASLLDMNFSASDACALHTWQATAFETESSGDSTSVANAYRSLLLTLAAQGAAVNARYLIKGRQGHV